MSAATQEQQKPEIPVEVFEALEEVREDASTNMLDYRRVLKEVQAGAWHGAAHYLEAHKDDYMDILNAFGAWSMQSSGDDE